ncbi:MAG: hypothetical protein IJ175_07045 [Clostridia bacterium]|nr:hypothetical protein [Clostridia bacterium]
MGARFGAEKFSRFLGALGGVKSKSNFCSAKMSAKNLMFFRLARMFFAFRLRFQKALIFWRVLWLPEALLHSNRRVDLRFAAGRLAFKVLMFDRLRRRSLPMVGGSAAALVGGGGAAQMQRRFAFRCAKAALAFEIKDQSAKALMVLSFLFFQRAKQMAGMLDCAAVAGAFGSARRVWQMAGKQGGQDRADLPAQRRCRGGQGEVGSAATGAVDGRLGHRPYGEIR